MPDETPETDVPEWVKEMRELGYTVRVGTGTEGLPYYPEISYHNWPEPTPGFRMRLSEFLQKLWNHGAPFKRRVVHR